MAASPLSAAQSADAVIFAPVTRPCRTLQNYGKTLAWTWGAVLLCGLGYLFEKYVAMPNGWITDTAYRMFKNPAELPMRLFGLPHFIVGLMFMLSSKRMRGARSIGTLLGLTAIGIGFCVVFEHFGASGNPIMLLLFYFYFLIHGFRDEAFFYKAYGDMPKDAAATHERIVVLMQLLLLGILAALLVPAYMLYGEFKPEFKHPALEALFPADWPYLVRFLVMIAPMALLAGVVLWRMGRQFPGGLAGLWRAHRPILIVFLTSTAIILLPLASGPWTFNVVVLMHFVGWYLFGRYSLSKYPPKSPPAGLWPWMRTTVAGFSALHLGLAALVVVLVMISTYTFGKTGALEEIVGSKSFYYWTIIHVTLSFFPR